MKIHSLLTLTLASIVTLTSCADKKQAEPTAPAQAEAPVQSTTRSATTGHVVHFEDLMKRGGNASDVLKNTLETNSKVVLDFYAEWCGPCKKLGPVLDKLAPKYPDVLFVKINVDNFGSLSEQFAVKGIPALMFFKDGKRVDKATGFKSESDMKEILKKLD